MIGKILQTNELLPALHLVWDVYVSEIAPLQKPEAVAVFQEFIKYQNIRTHVEKRELIVFGVYNDQNELCGVSSIDYRGEIRLLYVRKEYQRQGMGRALMQMMIHYCANNLVITRMMIKAFPSSVNAMNHLGMVELYSVQTDGVQVYVPMECMIAPATMEKKSNNGKTVGVIIGVIVAVISLIVILAVMLFKETARFVEETPSGKTEQGEQYHSFDEWFDPFEDSDSTDGFTSALDQIEAYEEEVDYTISEESYLYQPDDTKTTKIDFEIYYPQVSGLDSGIERKINDELKQCAMQTVDEIYEHPSEKIKERVLSQEQPVLLDYVTYKVSYMTQDILCVMYEDYSFEGTKEDSFVGLRCKTVNVTTGEVYELTDIVEMSDEFVSDWIKVMRSEANSDTLLSGLTSDEMVMALSGADLYQESYRPVYFLSNTVIEIGFSFHMDKDDPANTGYGWVTAPFSMEEISSYSKDNNFWIYVK